MRKSNSAVALRSTLFLTRMMGKLGLKSAQTPTTTISGWGGPARPYIKMGLNATKCDNLVRRVLDGEKIKETNSKD